MLSAAPIVELKGKIGLLLKQNVFVSEKKFLGFFLYLTAHSHIGLAGRGQEIPL